MELCRDLLLRAEQRETQPVPVIFNLSSWAQRRPRLEEWLVEELITKYQVPPRTARAWVESDALLPLLDGLDEVPTAHREACVAACNDYSGRHLVPLAVCSRSADYDALATKLQLQRAVLVRPLTKAPADSYLAQTGEALAGLLEQLSEDAQFGELAITPLMLQVLSLTYGGLPVDAEGRRNNL